MKITRTLLTAVLLTALIAAAGFVLADDVDEEKVFFQYCKTCHSPNWALEADKSEENWKLTVERMNLQYKMFSGKEIPSDDQELILEYLLRETGDN